MFTRSITLGLAVLPYVFAAVHDVQVGEDGLTFSPEAFSAPVGDQVVFHFHPKNHTVTQSSFDNPCGPKDGGFKSGFMPVAANTSLDALPTFTITIEDEAPVWVFCGQGRDTPASHCGAGMIFSVNCPFEGANSFENFKKSALAIGEALKAEASSSMEAAPATESTYEYATESVVYGDYTMPPEPEATLVTETITLDQTSVWTTTYSSYPGSPAATPASAEGTIIKVIVGDGALAFDPPRVSAAPRDIIMFEFHAKNHTVTQSTFGAPCVKSNATDAFSSGFMPVDASLTEGFPTWNLTINDTTPIWAYCAQKTPASHCEQGMVFAINSVEDSPRNFSAFQNVAQSSTSSNSTATTSGADADPSDGALNVRVGTAGIVVVIAALAAML